MELTAFLVTTTTLVEAEDEVQASKAALVKLLKAETLAFDVQVDEAHHSRIVLTVADREATMKQLSLGSEAV